MNQIEVKVTQSFLNIKNCRTRVNQKDLQEVEIAQLCLNKVYTSEVPLTREKDKFKIFYFEECNVLRDYLENREDEEETEFENEVVEQEQKDYIIVYSDRSKIKYTIGKPEIILKRMLPFKAKILTLVLNKKKLWMIVAGYIINPYEQLKIKEQAVSLSEKKMTQCQFPIFNKKLKKSQILLNHCVKKIDIPLAEFIRTVETLDNPIMLDIDVNGHIIKYGIPKPEKKKIYNFAPVVKMVYGNFMAFVRRNARGNTTLVIRPRDEYEKTVSYRFWENKILSGMMYHFGKAVRRISRKTVNLYFEKESMKAEEGTFEVFQRALKERTSANYFIIDRHSEDYKKIKKEKNVICKYSFQYYWLIYRANNAITTEAPAHMNILRSANRYIRLRNVEIEFIFLQHGVTYMKCHGEKSAFVKGQEAEPSYIFVDSEKERDVVVDMLKIPEERVLITGLPIFSTIQYGHITQNSEDYVTIMLTFKPYEERLDDFQTSRYYKTILELYAVLKKYISEEKIRIVAHPRIRYLLETTSLKESMWDGSISEVIGSTKLMITDYSSVAYNSFYQGAAVIFYQEDLMEYEAICGKLIPSDEEYIGMRAFDINMFEEEIQQIIKNKEIQLSIARTEQQEENYRTINSFSDGKNIERICEKLKEMRLI